VPHLEPRLFSFNSPLGACDECNGLGVTLEADVDLIVTEPEKSMNKGCMKYYKNTANSLNVEWQKMSCLMEDYNIDPNKPWNELTKKEQKIILVGSDRPVHYHMTTTSGNHYERTEFIEGVQTLIQRRYFETQSKFGKEYYKSYMTESICHKCNGARLNEIARSVKINKLDIYEFTTMSIDDAYLWINNLTLDPSRAMIAKMVIDEVNNRLRFLVDVGLGYISLDRTAGTLSGGEAQRIRLATQIGSKLQGVLYVLDEPSIGLHQRDNDRLITTLKNMRDLGNTLIVVEHDEDTMLAADYIVDIGPGAGIHGGEVIVAGTPQEVMDCEESITGQYLSGKKSIAVPKNRRKGNGKFIEIKGCKENNLKNINVKFPLGKFICVTGVSGSGKSTLVNEILAKAIKQSLNRVRVKPGEFKEIKGLENVDKIVEITQDPIGRTPRSNPVTYTGVFDVIRDLFALTPEAKLRGYAKGRFSFNVKGGRCEACQGDGVKRIRMNFLPDVYIPCTECHGSRYNEETLQVTFKGKTIADILDMSIEEAIIFFANIHKIKSKLQILSDVGLNYIKLGQSATTLSGGEAQRVKLASELQKIPTGKTVFILDEPTTGLHTADVEKLLGVLQRITDNGDTVICIEHNLDVIKSADYLIDLGPEGGQNGGTVLAKGTPEQIMKVEKSYTGQYLKKNKNRNVVK
jgi:excinuclease ABC subunit A